MIVYRAIRMATGGITNATTTTMDYGDYGEDTVDGDDDDVTLAVVVQLQRRNVVTLLCG